MMIARFLVFASGLCALAGCASGPTRHEIHSECRLEMDAARTAIQLRDKGKDKMIMLRTLPPLQTHSSRLLHQMYQIVDESYACPRLNEIVYGIYRYEVCARQLRHQPVPGNISSVYVQLQGCQSRYHRQVSSQAVACVRAVFVKPHDQDANPE